MSLRRRTLRPKRNEISIEAMSFREAIPDPNEAVDLSLDNFLYLHRRNTSTVAASESVEISVKSRKKKMDHFGALIVPAETIPLVDFAAKAVFKRDREWRWMGIFVRLSDVIVDSLARMLARKVA